MSMKKFDLAKSLGLKVTGQMKSRGVPDRFAQGAADALDKRERRSRDAAAGLVPFACKLPAEMVKQLHERASAHEDGINGVMAELLNAAMPSGVSEAPEATEVPAKKAAAKKTAAAKKA